MVVLKRNVVFLDGANAVGKTYAIGKIVEGLTAQYPDIRTEVVSIKRFYDDIDPKLLARIYSYKLETFTLNECMYILTKHKLMLEHINILLASDTCDLVLVDRGLTSFIIYNVLTSNTLNQDINYNNIALYIEKEIKPLLMAQNSLYVHLRFNLRMDKSYIEQAIARTVNRLDERGVLDYDLAKISLIVSLMEEYHSQLHRPDETSGYLLSAEPALVHYYFPDVINTDSSHVEVILERL
jgi:hypothetical protein